MTGQRCRQREFSGQPTLDQRDAPAWRIGFVARLVISWTVRQAQTAFDALVGKTQQFLTQTFAMRRSVFAISFH